MITDFIPNTFNLGGVIHNVKAKRECNESAVGSSYGSRALIEIARYTSGKALSITSMENTFYHELAHSLMYSMAEYELRNKETFIQGLGNLLYEYQRTKS